MALNSKESRSSATLFLVPSFGALVWPDGTIDATDRQAAVLCYYGIAAFKAFGIIDTEERWMASVRRRAKYTRHI